MRQSVIKNRKYRSSKVELLFNGTPGKLARETPLMRLPSTGITLLVVPGTRI